MSKVAVITGAGAGAGRATVEEFAPQGYDVALLSRVAIRDGTPCHAGSTSPEGSSSGPDAFRRDVATLTSTMPKHDLPNGRERSDELIDPGSVNRS